MPDAVAGMTPPLVWKYFAEFSKVPRCSKHEQKAGQFVLDTAKKLGLTAAQDRAGNVVVRKPASAGREHVNSVCLQGHLDMVCEKNEGTAHDFSRDPIVPRRVGDHLYATGTTLGADNGIAVATNLAIMEDKTLQHGALELLFTVDEETGLTGAHNLQPGFVQSRTLMNLDSEEEGALYVGCSGGKDTTGTWSVEFEPAPDGWTGFDVALTGLRGGHSGLEIDKGRGNALKMLNRVLIALGEGGARLSKIDGGNKRNAIPREARATVHVPKGKAAGLQSLVSKWNDTLRAELRSVEPDLRLAATEIKGRRGQVLKKKHQKLITGVLAALPHGVVKMNADISWLVETSTNVAVISTKGKKIELATSQRSSVASEIQEIAQTVRTIMEMGGAEVTQGDGYPGWNPDLESPILKLAIKTYEQLYGKQPEVKAVHAGLECGIIGEKYPGMDMVSFGPTLEGVHSPDEKIHIDTVPKFWNFLTAILKNVS